MSQYHRRTCISQYHRRAFISQYAEGHSFPNNTEGHSCPNTTERHSCPIKKGIYVLTNLSLQHHINPLVYCTVNLSNAARESGQMVGYSHRHCGVRGRCGGRGYCGSGVTQSSRNLWDVSVPRAIDIHFDHNKSRVFVDGFYR